VKVLVPPAGRHSCHNARLLHTPACLPWFSEHRQELRSRHKSEAAVRAGEKEAEGREAGKSAQEGGQEGGAQRAEETEAGGRGRPQQRQAQKQRRRRRMRQARYRHRANIQPQSAGIRSRRGHRGRPWRCQDRAYNNAARESQQEVARAPRQQQLLLAAHGVAGRRGNSDVRLACRRLNQWRLA